MGMDAFQTTTAFVKYVKDDSNRWEAGNAAVEGVELSVAGKRGGEPPPVWLSLRSGHRMPNQIAKLANYSGEMSIHVRRPGR